MSLEIFIFTSLASSDPHEGPALLSDRYDGVAVRTANDDETHPILAVSPDINTSAEIAIPDEV
jgi:hypothetical protein